jgi:hypothetical protein
LGHFEQSMAEDGFGGWSVRQPHHGVEKLRFVRMDFDISQAVSDEST